LTCTNNWDASRRNMNNKMKQSTSKGAHNMIPTKMPRLSK
jgi:hypothetical protein